jgi:hypothetical protein
MLHYMEASKYMFLKKICYLYFIFTLKTSNFFLKVELLIINY